MFNALIRASRTLLAAAWLSSLGAAIPGHAANLSLDDLFSVEGAADVSVAPSGRYLAAVVRGKDSDLLAVQDLSDGKTEAIARIGRRDAGKMLDTRISTVVWKTDGRLLFTVHIFPAKGVRWSQLMNSDYRKLGARLFSIDREGKNLVRMLAKNRNSELDNAYNLGAIRSLLPRDDAHILMTVDGMDGRSLFKVDVRTGEGDVVERARDAVIDWWLDLDGQPVVQVEASRGTLRFSRRDSVGRWKKFYSVRIRDLKQQDEYEPLGPSDQDGKFYVLARPAGAQRRGVYLYDLRNESFGPPVAENPRYDLSSAVISRDGRSVARFCYVAHVRICESTDPKLDAHMKGVRQYFEDSANVYVSDASDDGDVLLLFVEGPSDPPAYYHYQVATKKIQLVGLMQDAMDSKRMPTASVMPYTARDGLELQGYLTRPPGAADATGLPLVVMPHGGPEARDQLTYDMQVQYLAARGYAVFQPNFRGSDGFGLAFIEKGYREWGRRMQDDVSDGVQMLVERKIVDPKRVCIVGASYGGYAALAGATLTPDLYRCAVSVSGVSDLREMLKSRGRIYGKDSDIYAYWVKQIGDPDADAARIDAVSPALHVDRIKVPILLIHGDKDDTVPYEQSKILKKALDKSGRNTQLITLEDEGHSGFSEDNARLVLTSIESFVGKHLGPGFAAP
ncbi:MAG TPA: S9 family peptidase [Steroidobacteraceae bacterium]|nr:S9 family peptidase [Steroidobacteraceae bacterium]